MGGNGTANQRIVRTQRGWQRVRVRRAQYATPQHLSFQVVNVCSEQQ